MAVQLSTKFAQSGWTAICPTNTVTSEAQSLAFMKKFAAVGISNILYLRSELPEDTFTTMNIDGFRTTMLKNSSHPIAAEICQTVKNGLKSLKDGYLKELHVVFYPNPDSQEIIESYKFAFELPKERAGVTPQESGEDGQLLKKSSLQLLRCISTVIQHTNVLPTTAQLTFRLYYNDEAPEGYAPQGFVPLSPKSLNLRFVETPPTPAMFGSISTAWHKLEVSMQSTLMQHPSQKSQQKASEEKSTFSPTFSPIVQPTQKRAVKRAVIPETEEMERSPQFNAESGQSLIAGSQMQPIVMNNDDEDETMMENNPPASNKFILDELEGGLDADDTFSMKDMAKAMPQSTKRKAASESKKSLSKTKKVGTKGRRGARNVKPYQI